ncbi:MAG: hypothetical protein WC254_05020 [Candidatus Woesearchaeota archaeon]|jgi:hypothetical protein
MVTNEDLVERRLAFLQFFKQNRQQFIGEDYILNLYLMLTQQELKLANETIPSPIRNDLMNYRSSNPFSPIFLSRKRNSADLCIEARAIIEMIPCDPRYWDRQGKGIIQLKPLSLDSNSFFHMSTEEDPELINQEELKPTNKEDTLSSQFPYRRPASLEEAVKAQCLYRGTTSTYMLTPLEHFLHGSGPGVNELLSADPRQHHRPSLVHKGILNPFACQVLRQRQYEGKHYCLVSHFIDGETNFGFMTLPDLDTNPNSPTFGYAKEFPQLIDTERKYTRLPRIDFAKKYAPLP